VLSFRLAQKLSRRSCGAAKPGRIVIGYLDNEPVARRLVRDKKNSLLIASNRNYPPIPFFDENESISGSWYMWFGIWGRGIPVRILIEFGVRN